MSKPLNLRLPDGLKEALQEKADATERETLTGVSIKALAKSVNFNLKRKKTAKQK